MPDLDTPDRDPAHLYPTFRERLAKAILEANSECLKFGVTEFYIDEGYRSSARQAYLYEQGRTRPGDIVTNSKVPDHHGYGMAADCYPKHKVNGAVEVWWDAPDAVLQQWRHCVHVQGLFSGMDWTGNMANDTGHVQFTDIELDCYRLRAIHYLHALGLTTP